MRNNKEITGETRLSDLVKQNSRLKDELPKINDKCNILNTPMGKIMMREAAIAEMSQHSGIF